MHSHCSPCIFFRPQNSFYLHLRVCRPVYREKMNHPLPGSCFETDFAWVLRCHRNERLNKVIYRSKTHHFRLSQRKKKTSAVRPRKNRLLFAWNPSVCRCTSVCSFSKSWLLLQAWGKFYNNEAWWEHPQAGGSLEGFVRDCQGCHRNNTEHRPEFTRESPPSLNEDFFALLRVSFELWKKD